jgi:hypothetical protein
MGRAAMPKASINEHSHAVDWEHDIGARSTQKAPYHSVDPVAQALRMKGRAQPPLRPRVALTVSAHYSASSGA